jgi:hypothetical protein
MAAVFDGRVLVTGKYTGHLLLPVWVDENQCIGFWLCFHYQTNLRNFFCWKLKVTCAFLTYPVPTEQEVWWGLEPVWVLWIKEKILPVLGIEPHSLVLAVRHRDVLLLTVTLSITTVKTSIIVTQQYCLLF